MSSLCLDCMHARHNFQQRNIETENTPEYVLDVESANAIVQFLHFKDILKQKESLGRTDILQIGSRTCVIHFLY